MYVTSHCLSVTAPVGIKFKSEAIPVETVTPFISAFSKYGPVKSKFQLVHSRHYFHRVGIKKPVVPYAHCITFSYGERVPKGHIQSVSKLGAVRNTEA
jgi:hypothetical protein